MMIVKNIDKFFLRNEELEAEHEKVGKRQLDMITDEFSMEVGSPMMMLGLFWDCLGSPELGFGLEIVKGCLPTKSAFPLLILPNKDDDEESERDWKAEAKEANRRLQEERNEVRDV